NLTDIEAACTDGKDRITEVVNLPTTGVNTERIWLLEHFADWFSTSLGTGSMYHRETRVSKGLMRHLDVRDASQVSADLAKDLRTKDGTSVGEGGAVAAGKEPTLGQVHERLDQIERRRPLYQPWFSGLAAGLACAAFVFLLGGQPYDMLGAFVGAGLGQWLRRRLYAHHLNQFFVTFVCVAVAALACVGTLRLVGLFDPVALQHGTAYIGAILFVIPGFPLITGCLDMAKLDFPSGVQRVMYVLCVILMATLAGWMVASLVGLNPQGFEPMDLAPWVECLLRFVFAFVGVWGFSVLFNSPQRMCLVAALIGAITDTLRLEMVDAGLAPEAGAFIGAMLAGLLSAAWRSAVAHGKLPAHMGYPRICLTVPSIVIMVPGMYMYEAMFQLGQFNTLSALDWAFRAFMIIICMPIGLTMTRVLTDRTWRYDL
ncbi:MAG: threonine/serine exporter family protein, partial [Bifidobacterium sp.]|nr:threonine/serine exporter family protein [Bifidobacterium sp.]